MVIKDNKLVLKEETLSSSEKEKRMDKMLNNAKVKKPSSEKGQNENAFPTTPETKILLIDDKRHTVKTKDSPPITLKGKACTA